MPHMVSLPNSLSFKGRCVVLAMHVYPTLLICLRVSQGVNVRFFLYSWHSEEGGALVSQNSASV